MKRKGKKTGNSFFSSSLLSGLPLMAKIWSYYWLTGRFPSADIVYGIVLVLLVLQILLSPPIHLSIYPWSNLHCLLYVCSAVRPSVHVNMP